MKRDELGRGGTGIVYEALRGHNVVVKLPIDVNDSQEGCELNPQTVFHIKQIELGGIKVAFKRFKIKDYEREREVMGRLHHRNIVQIYDSFQALGNFYVIMEFINTIDDQYDARL